jgi:hypothetical protein
MKPVSAPRYGLDARQSGQGQHAAPDEASAAHGRPIATPGENARSRSTVCVRKGYLLRSDESVLRNATRCFAQ